VELRVVYTFGKSDVLLSTTMMEFVMLLGPCPRLSTYSAIGVPIVSFRLVPWGFGVSPDN
jgi:hypothetical protein